MLNVYNIKKPANKRQVFDINKISVAPLTVISSAVNSQVALRCFSYLKIAFYKIGNLI